MNGKADQELADRGWLIVGEVSNKLLDGAWYLVYDPDVQSCFVGEWIKNTGSYVSDHVHAWAGEDAEPYRRNQLVRCIPAIPMEVEERWKNWVDPMARPSRPQN